MNHRTHPSTPPDEIRSILGDLMDEIRPDTTFGELIDLGSDIPEVGRLILSIERFGLPDQLFTVIWFPDFPDQITTPPEPILIDAIRPMLGEEAWGWVDLDPNCWEMRWGNNFHRLDLLDPILSRMGIESTSSSDGSGDLTIFFVQVRCTDWSS